MKFSSLLAFFPVFLKNRCTIFHSDAVQPDEAPPRPVVSFALPPPRWFQSVEFAPPYVLWSEWNGNTLSHRTVVTRHGRPWFAKTWENSTLWAGFVGPHHIGHVDSRGNAAFVVMGMGADTPSSRGAVRSQQQSWSLGPDDFLTACAFDRAAGYGVAISFENTMVVFEEEAHVIYPDAIPLPRCLYCHTIRFLEEPEDTPPAQRQRMMLAIFQSKAVACVRLLGTRLVERRVLSFPDPVLDALVLSPSQFLIMTEKSIIHYHYKGSMRYFPNHYSLVAFLALSPTRKSVNCLTRNGSIVRYFL